MHSAFPLPRETCGAWLAETGASLAEVKTLRRVFEEGVVGDHTDLATRWEDCRWVGHRERSQRLTEQGQEEVTPSTGQNVHPAVWLVPTAMLLVAVFPLPYGYYRVMRFVVTGTAAYLAYRLWNERSAFSPWLAAFVALAVLFNPVLPIHLSKSIWQPLNIGAAVCFAVHWWTSRREGRT